MLLIVSLLFTLQLLLQTNRITSFTISKFHGSFSKIRLSSVASGRDTILPEGIKKSITKPGNGELLKSGDVATIKYACYVKGESKPFSKSLEQRFVIGDGSMIDGWELSLPTMSANECATIEIIDPKFAYGSSGVYQGDFCFIPPNSPISMDIEILEAEDGVDLGTMASVDPLKPRTPTSIAEAYSTRRELAAIEEANKKGGVEGLIDRFKNYYFFGFFESATGEENPWFLRPSITFPIAFLIVFAAFYVTFIFGAITERGVQVTDELDELITQSFFL